MVLSGSVKLRWAWGLGFADPLQPTAATLQSPREFAAPFTFAELIVSSGASISSALRSSARISLSKLLLAFEHALVAHRFALADIGFDLGAIHRHLAQAHQASLLAEPQHLNKQIGQGI